MNAISGRKAPYQVRGRKGCFAAGTFLQTKDGRQVPIEDITIGTEVLCFDDTGGLDWGSVTDVQKHEDEDIYRYRFWGGKHLDATPNHWVLNQFQTFSAIATLTFEDGIVDENGHIRPFINSEPVGAGDVFTVIVDPHHTFVANGLRVHNGGLGVGVRDKFVAGRKGGGKGDGGSTRTAQEAPNTLRSRSTARLVDAVAQGPIKGLVGDAKGIFLNETAVEADDGTANFDGVEWDFRAGTPDQDHLPGFPSIQSETVVGVEVTNATPVIRTLPSTDIDAVRITLQFRALTYQNPTNGDLLGTSVKIAIDVRENGGSFQEVIADTIEGKTTSLYEYSKRINLEPGTGPWDVRVRRVTEDYDKAIYQTDFTWARFTEIVDEKLIYPNTALVGLAADSEFFGGSPPERAYLLDGLICRVPTNYDPETREYTGIWDGTFKIAWTNCPPWILLEMITNTEWGVGEFIDIDAVDTASLYTIAQYCDELVDDGYGGQEPRFTCNGVIRTQEEVYRLIQTITSVFRGMGYWSSGAVSFSNDMPKDPSKLVTAANVLDGEFIYSETGQKARHSVAIVYFNDPDDFYRPAPEVYEDTALIKKMGWVPKSTQAAFCTSRGQAHRMGRWLIESENSEKETVTYKASMDHADVVPGEIISILDPDRAAVRFGGRTKNATLSSVTLDAEVTLVADETYVLAVTLPDGTIEERPVTNTAGVYSVLNLETDLSAAPAANAVWLLIGSDVAPTNWKVVANREEKTNVFEITGLYHDKTKYARVEQNVILDSANTSTLPTGPLGKPSDIDLTEYLYKAGPATKAAVTVSFKATSDVRAVYYEKQVKRPGGTFKTIELNSELSFDVLDITKGEYSFRIRAVNALGAPSAWETETKILLGTQNPASDVEEFNINVIDDEAHLSWRPVTDLDLAYYVLKFSPKTSGAIYSEAVILVEKIAPDSTTITVPAMVGTYFIKAVDQSDPPVESLNAASVISNVAGLRNMNSVETVTESPTFAGDKENCYVENGALRTMSSDTIADWTSLDLVKSIAEGLSGTAAVAYYYLDQYVDLLAAYTCRVSASVKASGVSLDYPISAWTTLDEVERIDGLNPEDWDVVIQIRTTPDDPNDGGAVWTNWKTFTIGDYHARGFDFRVILTSTRGTVQVVLEELVFTIDMPDRFYRLNDQTCPAGGLHVTFDPAFAVAPTIAIDAQNMQSGDYYTKSNITASGFDLRFFNSSDAGIERTFDLLAQGYGSAT